MATGIVSVGLSFAGQTLLSDMWMAVTAAAWMALAAGIVAVTIRDRGWLRAAVRSPASLTAAAATAVLGSLPQSARYPLVSLTLLALAAVICAVIAVRLARAWPLPSSGSLFMTVVALESLGGLAALEAGAGSAMWLIYPALALCGIGLVCYVFVFVRFDPRELLRGLGDHWVAGGALAISALSLSAISGAARRHGGLPALGRPTADLAAVIWILSALWLPVLVGCELLAPRLGYQVRRWSTLFPVGMYAASGFEVARKSWLGFAGSFASVWIWVAVALWLLLVAGMLRPARRAPVLS